jgi:branched-chain amino acid transport system permease protein
MRATSLDQETALAQGVNVGRMFSLAWAMSAALAALAGMLIGTGAGGVEATTALVALKALPSSSSVASTRSRARSSQASHRRRRVADADLPAGVRPVARANFDVVVPYLILVVSLMIRPYGLFGTPEVQRV